MCDHENGRPKAPKVGVAHWPSCAEWTARAHTDRSSSAALVQEPDPQHCRTLVPRTLWRKKGYINRNPQRWKGMAKETQENVEGAADGHSNANNNIYEKIVCKITNKKNNNQIVGWYRHV